jgi:thioredoxin-related protein
MKRLLIVLGLIASLCSNARGLEWLTDLPTAMARAQTEKKAVLLDFTGSDWCPWCQKLKSEVFDRFEFAVYAAANLIMVEVDFPRRKELNADQVNANYALASKYGIKGYPTIVVLNSDGQVLGQCGYVEGGPTAFCATIEKFPGMPHKGQYLVSRADSYANSSANSQGTPVRPSKPGAAPQPPVAPAAQYGELTLKGVSGVGSRRLALINNETLMAGERANVKSFGTNIAVTVKEIRDDSVVIVVKGQPHELSLAGPPGKP